MPYDTTLHAKFLAFFENLDQRDVLRHKDLTMVAYEVLSRTSFSRKLSQPEVLRSVRRFDHSGIGIRALLANNTFQEAYPLHDSYTEPASDRLFLWENWANPWLSLIRCQPLTTVRLYFGEQVAFYFAWLGFYTAWLTPPALAGCLVVLYGLVTVSGDVAIREICSLNQTAEIYMCPLCNYHYCKPWKLGDSCFYSKLTYLVRI